MNVRTVAASVASVALAAMGGSTLLPGVAQAAWVCQSGYVCIYQDINATGSTAVLPALNPLSGQFTGKVDDFRTVRFTNGTTVQDAASSVVNLTSTNLILYRDVNGKGDMVCVRPNTTVNLTAAWVYSTSDGALWQNFNDQASSAKLSNSITCVY